MPLLLFGVWTVRLRWGLKCLQYGEEFVLAKKDEEFDSPYLLLGLSKVLSWFLGERDPVFLHLVGLKMAEV
jgi:hypothetical protein